MSNLKALIPCRANHAIKEAVLTVFVDAPIGDIASFQELEKQELPFKRFEVINQNQLSITVSGNAPNINSEKLNEVGFKFIDYIEGKPSKVFQGMNESNRYFFSFHDLAYVRWNEFKEMFDKCIQLLSEHKGKFSVKAYSLHVIDEFSWKEKSPIPYKDLFRKNNKIIPEIFYESNRIDYLISRSYNVDDKSTKLDGTERIQINGVSIKDSDHSKLLISHNYTEVMNDSKEAFVLIQSEDFSKKITAAHKKNKELIKELFNDEVLQIINYN